MNVRNGIRFIAAVAAIGLFSGCGPSKTAGKPAASTPTLAQQLDTMAPEDQLDYLRKMDQKMPNDPTVAFHIGNAYYSLGSSLPEEENNRSVAYYDLHLPPTIFYSVVLLI